MRTSAGANLRNGTSTTRKPNKTSRQARCLPPARRSADGDERAELGLFRPDGINGSHSQFRVPNPACNSARLRKLAESPISKEITTLRMDFRGYQLRSTSSMFSTWTKFSVGGQQRDVVSKRKDRAFFKPQNESMLLVRFGAFVAVTDADSRWEYFLDDDGEGADVISGRWVKVLSILERCSPVGEQEARQALESRFYRREGRRAMLKGEPFGQEPGRLYSPGTHQWLSWWRGYSEAPHLELLLHSLNSVPLYLVSLLGSTPAAHL